MPFQFQITPQNTALQQLQVIDSLEGRRESRDMQKQSLQLRMQEAAEKMDVRKRERTRQGLEGMASVAGAARNAAEWDEGIRSLVSQGYKEFESELGKWSPDRAAFNLRKAQDAKTLFESSPDQQQSKIDFEAKKFAATVPDRMRIAQAGKTSVSVGAPSMPIPKIDPATGKFLGFEPQAQPQAPGRAGAADKKDSSGLATPTINALEENSLKSGEGLARVTNVINQFKPEYQQLGTRWRNAGVALGEKTGLREPSEEERGRLTEFTQYRRSATEILNAGIKDQTGASMGVQEAERIIATMPNAGTGLLDGDSPTEFMAKARGIESALRNAQMRANWARRHGLDPLKTGVELQDVPKIVNERGAAIEALIRKEKPTWGADEIKQAVRRQLGQEFGMNR
ncbi:MAG: hypothetical protein E6Q97_33805 [Desulfurellales bacterium]|nr:MAG: hypothetical protein E6Q97_33805 [Desulfurellales bacterium]